MVEKERSGNDKDLVQSVRRTCLEDVRKDVKCVYECPEEESEVRLVTRGTGEMDFIIERNETGERDEVKISIVIQIQSLDEQRNNRQSGSSYIQGVHTVKKE